jgi:hypothetical protein
MSQMEACTVKVLVDRLVNDAIESVVMNAEVAVLHIGKQSRIRVKLRDLQMVIIQLCRVSKHTRIKTINLQYLAESLVRSNKALGVSRSANASINQENLASRKHAPQFFYATDNAVHKYSERSKCGGAMSPGNNADVKKLTYDAARPLNKEICNICLRDFSFSIDDQIVVDDDLHQKSSSSTADTIS